MKRTQLVAPGQVTRRIQEAHAAYARRDFVGAIELLESADRLAPANPGILIELGQVHGWRYDYVGAERYFEKALRFASRKSELLATIANRCQYFRNPELYERYLRLALAQPDATPQTCIKLAELYERLRRIPEAGELVERALKLDSICPEALLVRARLERLAGRLETAEQFARALLTRPIADPTTHAQAWYELATVLDREEKFDDAMTAFLEAKALLRPQVGELPTQLQAFFNAVKHVESGLTAGLLKRWTDQGAALQPARRVALLCGHARSGTTLLEQVLDSHPDIVSAEETPIFQEDALAPLERQFTPGTNGVAGLDSASLPALQASRAAYFRFIELSNGSPVAGRCLLDKNPMLTPFIPAFIRLLPEAKLLVAMRDPRDVVLSCFMQPHPLNVGTAAFLDLAGAVGYYANIMGFWRTLAPMMPAPYLEVRYEDLVADLESVSRKTLDFLGVPWDDRVLAFQETARKKRVISPSYADVTQPVYQRARGRWRNYQKYLEPHLAAMEPLVKAFGYQ
jgi:tetratricopeptide (TPR) repeat protein